MKIKGKYHTEFQANLKRLETECAIEKAKLSPQELEKERQDIRRTVYEIWEKVKCERASKRLVCNQKKFMEFQKAKKVIESMAKVQVFDYVAELGETDGHIRVQTVLFVLGSMTNGKNEFLRIIDQADEVLFSTEGNLICIDFIFNVYEWR